MAELEIDSLFFNVLILEKEERKEKHQFVVPLIYALIG